MTERTGEPVEPTLDDQDPDADYSAEPEQSEEPIEFASPDGFGPADPDDIPSADLP